MESKSTIICLLIIQIILDFQFFQFFYQRNERVHHVVHFHSFECIAPWDTYRTLVLDCTCSNACSHTFWLSYTTGFDNIIVINIHFISIHSHGWPDQKCPWHSLLVLHLPRLKLSCPGSLPCSHSSGCPLESSYHSQLI